MEVVLTMIDTAGIQDYIFSSNRLRENVGASLLVELATRDWVHEELHQLGKTNLPDREWKIEADDLVAELVYAGGGNTVILFATLDAAHVFTQRLTQRVLRKAPGLELIIAHRGPFKWEPDGVGFYKEEFEKLRGGALAQKKRTRLSTPLPLPGLGVTEECPSTGMVAAEQVEDPKIRNVSSEVAAKVNDGLREKSKKRLHQLFDPDDRFEFSDELDHLGRKGGEESYIAVVHIDGNDMGGIIEEYVTGAATNRGAITRMRDCSDAIDRASKKALKVAFSHLARRIDSKDGAWMVEEVRPKLEECQRNELDGQVERAEPKCIRLFQDENQDEKKRKYGGKPCWPFRLLVQGGDDLTFVCNGQIGISLAAIYMRKFTELTAQEFAKLEGKFPASAIHTGAGICIVKTHYPFRRAYELSEALAHSAKRMLREKEMTREASALDWHISSTGLSGSLETIRNREYKAPEGNLQMRPVWLARASDWRTWENFNHLVAVFNYCEEFAGRRNKLKALRTALRGGKDAVRRFLESYKVELPPLTGGSANLHEEGWAEEHCAYFDALEAMDHHFLLEGGNDE